jgi:acetylornithine deacetylase/succinyl-diaminopimelate desuccinylase-like protein
MSVDAAIRVFDQRRDAYLQDLLTFLRFPTISAQSAHAGDVKACAEWVRRKLADAGLHTELIETEGHPIVFADSGPALTPDAPTLLFYGHYDVQPLGDERLWKTPGFEPTIRDGAIYARGSADDKGQVMTHLAALQCWSATGTTWPCRIKVLFEGEEEIGSPHLAPFVKANRERLACDYVVLSDTSKFDATTPALACASRGLIGRQIYIDGPTNDLHSGHYGGAVANPANVLARIVAALHDENGRVNIPGFYDDVVELSAEERQKLNAHGMTDADLLKQTGSPAPYGEAGYTTAERCGARPTLDVNGICGGYIGEGSSTIIPAKAFVKITMRLVANQDPQKIGRAFDETVRRLCPPTVRMKVTGGSGCWAYMAPTDSPGMHAAARALEAAYGKPAVHMREGGTLPILPLFKQELGADSIMLGFAAPDCALHSPNEFFHVSDFETGTRCIIRFLQEIASEHAR